MKRTATLLSIAALLALVPALVAQDEIPRTASGRPDLSGSYDAATLTPLERPVRLGERAYLTPEEAAEIAEEERLIQEGGVAKSDANREAPPEGGAKCGIALRTAEPHVDQLTEALDQERILYRVLQG